MQAKVYLNQPLTQDRYGLHFDRGEAQTDNEYIIKKLQAKGVKVEILKAEKTIDEMTVSELKKYAEENNIEIPSKVKTKAGIIELLTNNDADKDDPDTNTDNPDITGQNPETNPDTNTDNPEGEGDTNTEPTGE